MGIALFHQHFNTNKESGRKEARKAGGGRHGLFAYISHIRFCIRKNVIRVPDKLYIVYIKLDNIYLLKIGILYARTGPELSLFAFRGARCKVHTSACQVGRASPYTSTHSRKGRRAVESCTRKPFQLKMRVVLALLLALCAANAAHIRSTPTAQTTETVKRSPRFAFHTYETQMMAKGDDGEEGESFVSMLPESMFIEMGGSDSEGGAGAATGSQAAPESESKTQPVAAPAQLAKLVPPEQLAKPVRQVPRP